jgi:hypothetical protein
MLVVENERSSQSHEVSEICIHELVRMVELFFVSRPSKRADLNLEGFSFLVKPMRIHVHAPT